MDKLLRFTICGIVVCGGRNEESVPDEVANVTAERVSEFFVVPFQ